MEKRKNAGTLHIIHEKSRGDQARQQATGATRSKAAEIPRLPYTNDRPRCSECSCTRTLFFILFFFLVLLLVSRRYDNFGFSRCFSFFLYIYFVTLFFSLFSFPVRMGGCYLSYLSDVHNNNRSAASRQAGCFFLFHVSQHRSVCVLRIAPLSGRGPPADLPTRTYLYNTHRKKTV